MRIDREAWSMCGRYGVKIVAAVVLAGMFAFAAFVMPIHVALHSEHDGCAVCNMARHAPLPEPDAAADIRPVQQTEWLGAITAHSPYVLTQTRVWLSRAPPLS
ncbi:MAG: hypothetical protein LBP68_03770 [Acidobacteriota bacterium]|nr:hypothetical protein [Acidobacteriota bacterium]